VIAIDLLFFQSRSFEARCQKESPSRRQRDIVAASSPSRKNTSPLARGSVLGLAVGRSGRVFKVRARICSQFSPLGCRMTPAGAQDSAFFSPKPFVSASTPRSTRESRGSLLSRESVEQNAAFFLSLRSRKTCSHDGLLFDSPECKVAHLFVEYHAPTLRSKPPQASCGR